MRNSRRPVPKGFAVLAGVFLIGLTGTALGNLKKLGPPPKKPVATQKKKTDAEEKETAAPSDKYQETLGAPTQGAVYLVDQMMTLLQFWKR